jgi:hypothetical protein
MAKKSDALLTAAEKLQRVLAADVAGQERDWADRVDRALAQLADAIGKRAATWKSPEGKVVEVESPRLPSPTVARRGSELRRDLDGFLEQARTLQTDVRHVARTFGGGAEVANLAGALPVAPEAGAVPDFGVFRQRAEQLVEGVQRYIQQEAGLILESVNIDVGAGD